MDWLAIITSMGLLDPVLALIGGLLLLVMKKFLSQWIEAKDMAALHSAIMTGIEAALEEGPDAALDDIKKKALIHMNNSVPDAIRRLVPGDGVVDNLMVRYYHKTIRGLQSND